MSGQIIDFIPENDTELETAVRELTGYGDMLDADVYDAQVRLAKMRLYNKTGRSDFYENTNLTQALVAYTAMLTKESVENIPIEGYKIGDESVQFRDYSESQLLELLAEILAEALSELDDGTKSMRNTSNYISGKPAARRSVRKDGFR